MMHAAYVRFCRLEQKLRTDAAYLYLEKLRLAQEPRFRAAMAQLTHAQREIIFDYFGICAELSQRATELACFSEFER